MPRHATALAALLALAPALALAQTPPPPPATALPPKGPPARAVLDYHDDTRVHIVIARAEGSPQASPSCDIIGASGHYLSAPLHCFDVPGSGHILIQLGLNAAQFAHYHIRVRDGGSEIYYQRLDKIPRQAR